VLSNAGGPQGSSPGIHQTPRAPAVFAGRWLQALSCAQGVEITFEEDRQGGVLNGPRAYFHDPDGTVLEFIDLTSYAGTA